MKIGPLLIAAALVALVVPAASADVCFGPGCGTGGGGGGGGTSPFNHISISNNVGTSSQPVNEDDDCIFVIHRSNPRGANTSVHWHTKDGTATSQPEGPPGSTYGTPTQGISDYQAGSGIATFTKEQPRNFTISVHTNVDFSPDTTPEYFFVVISHPVNGVIVDNSGKCVIAQPQGE
jgi:hypothetical protein